MTDDRLLGEILRSPLDDMAPRRSKRGAIVGASFLLVLLGGGSLLLLRPGDDTVEATAETTTAAAVVVDDSVVTTAPGDTAAFAATTSTTVAAAQVFPEPGVHHEMVALGDGKVLMFGGFIPLDDDTGPLEGTWVFDATVGEWSVSDSDPAPSPRFGHAFALHPPTARVVLFGGGTTQPRSCPMTRLCTGPEDNQVWHYDPGTDTWENMTPPVPDQGSWPTIRFGTRFAYEPVTERLIMFSGVGVLGEDLNPTFYEDTWAYDPVTNEWEDLTLSDDDAPRPLGRAGYGMVWSEEARRVMLFGGDSLSGLDDDHLWAFDPETATWEDRGVTEMGPYERWHHLLTVDPQSDRLVLIGGSGSVLTPIASGTSRSVDVLDEVWTWSEAEGWLARNRMETPMSPVSGVAVPRTLSIIAYDGHDVMSYDTTADLWASTAERQEPDDD